MVVRFFFLSNHYRSPINYSDQELTAAREAFDRVTSFIADLDFMLKQATEHAPAIERKDIEEELSDYKDIGDYINRFIDDEKAVTLQESNMEDHETVDTDIAAILLPLAHADENIIWHIAYNGNIRGFSESVQRECARFRDKAQMGRKAEEYFIQTFRIPVFESYKFLPGYRYENTPLGKDIPFEEMMHIVKAAYNVWLDKNFSKR